MCDKYIHMTCPAKMYSKYVYAHFRKKHLVYIFFSTDKCYFIGKFCAFLRAKNKNGLLLISYFRSTIISLHFLSVWLNPFRNMDLIYMYLFLFGKTNSISNIFFPNTQIFFVFDK